MFFLRLCCCNYKQNWVFVVFCFLFFWQPDCIHKTRAATIEEEEEEEEVQTEMGVVVL